MKQGSRGRFDLTRPLLVVLATILLALPVSPLARAATSPGSASGLSISPLRQELTLKPGQADKIDISLKNITSGPVIAKVTIRDFVSDNVTGNPKIITDPNVKSPASIRQFLINPPDVRLATGEQKNFNIPVQAPGNITPGAYYGLVEYKAVPDNGGNSSGNSKVALSASVSQLVLITVPGNVTERMELTQIHIYNDKSDDKENTIFTSIPKSAGIEIKNIGTGFGAPFGHVSLQNSSGKEIYAYEMNGNITRGLVLPGSTRIFRNDLKNISRPGRYKVVASISYGSGSAILTGQKTFWYLPVWMLLLAALIIVLLIGAIWLVWGRYRRATKSSGYRK